MLSPDKVATRDPETWDENQNSAQIIDIDLILGIIKRQWRIVAVAVTVCVILTLAYLMTAVPSFTADSAVLIDRSTGEVVNQLSNAGIGVDDESSVLSQVEVLKSETIIGPVVDKLNLLNDPRLTNPQKSLLATAIGTVKSIVDVRKWFGSDEAERPADSDRRHDMIDMLSRQIAVSRVGRTYVLSISYTSIYPDLAMNVANEMANAYLLDKLNSKYEATRRAGEWLQARIDELKQQVVTSDLAVQKFRADNGLLTASGVLVTDQQLSELNSALIVAQSESARAKAKYDRIKAIIDSGRTDAIVTDVLDSSISNELRKKYLDASKLEADISRRLGSDHIQAVRLRQEMKELERLMFEELGRIAESYQSEVTVAEAREQALRANVQEAQKVTANAGETQVQLRELQRTADTYRDLYQSFLQRYQEATQQQSFPITEARVISRASMPDVPSAPKKPMILALGVFLGIAVGGAIGAFREYRERFFRTGDQIRETLGAEFLGTIPLVPASESAGRPREADMPRMIGRNSTIAQYVIDHPLSNFAETLRSTKIAVDLAADEPRSTKVVAFVSTLPGEGKSTVAINFAQLLAMQGARCLLIDADLRNPGATRAIGRHAEKGLLEALIEGAPLEDLLLFDPKTKLAFLPAIVTRRVPHSSELLASPAMNALLRSAQRSFDYVILDLPPLAPVVDARAVASQVDNFVYVVEWGGTSRRSVQASFRSDLQILRKCAGVILNKVDEQKMHLYRAYGSSDYYYSRYASYYREK